MKFIITKVLNLRHAITASLEQLKNEDGKVCILVPDKLSVTMEKELFSYLNIESSFNIEISTITRFSQKILTEQNIRYTPMTKIGSAILVKKILTQERDNLKLFNTPSFSYNYSDTIFKTLTQFKSSQITSNDMYLTDNLPSQLSDKIHDLRILSERYEETKAGLVDSTDRLNLLAVNIKNSEIVKNTAYYFVGFDDFTAQGYSIIEQLVRFSKSVNVFAYNKMSKNSYIYLDELEQKLKNIAYAQSFPLEIQQIHYGDSILHKFLVENIYSARQNTFEIKDAEISLHNAKNFNEEIEFVARSIRERVLNGAKFNEFGIACFDIESHKNAIKEVMNKYEINYYIDSSTSVNDTIYFKFFINYLKLFAQNFQTENLMQFINSPFLDINQINRIKLVRIIKKLNISNNIFSLKLDGSLSDDLTYILNIFNKFSLRKVKNIEDLINNLKGLEDFLDIRNKVDNLIAKMDDLYAKKILMQAPDAFDNLLGEVAKFYNELDLDELVDILKSAGKELKIMPIPQSLDCVQILDAKEIFTSFDNLYVLNTTSKTAPQITQDIGIILDKDIEQLEFKNKLAPTIAHLNKMAKFKLFNSVQMFNKKLVMTMSINNIAELSEIVKEFQKIIRVNGEIIKVNEIKNSIAYKPLSKGDLIEFLSDSKNNNKEEIMDFYGIKRYEIQKRLSDKAIMNLHFKEISCSALENYFLCPFAYFLNYTLRLKEEEKSGIAKVDIGNIVHNLAENYYKMKSKHANVEIQSFVRNNIDDFMLKDNRLSQFINSSIYFNLVKEATRFVEHLKYLDDNCLFEPSYHEYDFGLSNNRTIPLTNEVFLRGKIDRVDFWKNYVRIIDYKTGNVEASFEDLYYGKKLQLFLYAKFARNYFSKTLAGSFYLPVKNTINNMEGVKPYRLTGFILKDENLIPAWDKNLKIGQKSDLLSVAISPKGNFKNDGSATKIVSDSEFENMINYSADVAKLAIEEITSGNITPAPIEINSRQTSCSFCPYIAICRKNSMQIGVRSKKAVDIDSFGGDNG